jgi:hypothetical protein
VEKVLRDFSRQENLRFSRVLRTRHVIHDERQAVYPQPASKRVGGLGPRQCLDGGIRHGSWNCSAREVGVAIDDHASLQPPHNLLRAELLLAERQSDLDAEVAENVASLVAIDGVRERDGQVPRDPDGCLDFLVDGQFFADGADERDCNPPSGLTSPLKEANFGATIRGGRNQGRADHATREERAG